MLHSAVYIAILILASLNFYTECGRSNRTLCPKEMNVFLTNQSKANGAVYIIYLIFHNFPNRVFGYSDDALIDVCVDQVLLLLFLTASADMWPNICSNDTGCCNKTTRNKLRTQITTSVLNLIQERNEDLRRRLKYVYDDLEGENDS